MWLRTAADTDVSRLHGQLHVQSRAVCDVQSLPWHEVLQTPISPAERTCSGFQWVRACHVWGNKPACQLKPVCRAAGFGRGRLIKGPVLGYRKPNGPAGRRKCGWSARLRPVWPSLRWGMWSMPCHCTVHWSCTEWERHLAGAAGETKADGQQLHFTALTRKKHQGEPTSLRMKEGSSLVRSSQVERF